MRAMMAGEERFQIEEDPVATYEEFYRRGWTDGLPIIPPTPMRVEEMMAGLGRPALEEVAEIPPRRARATIQKIAVNAVMAGCHPSYFPVVVAAVEAMAEPAFNLYGVNCTTSGVCVCIVVNGPVRQELEINSSYGCLGPGWRANATIGRAVRLVQLNIGGAIPGEVSKSTHGSPGRYTMCLGEFEEKNPWQPLHVERGFAPQDSTVTVFSATCITSICDTSSKTARGTLTTIAHSMDWVGSNHMLDHTREGESLLVLNPDHAMVISRDGWSKEDAKTFLYEETKAVPLSRWPEERHERLIREGRVVNGVVSLHERPEDIVVVVAGGLGGYHSLWIPTWGDSRCVTKKVASKKKN